MGCERTTDERLQADKMDALYGEADAEARARLAAHLGDCEECRVELSALARIRNSSVMGRYFAFLMTAASIQ